MMTRERELLQQALDALDRAISDDRAYIRECKDAAGAIRAHLAAQPAPVPLTDARVIELARKAGGTIYTNRYYEDSPSVAFHHDALIRFVNGIAASPEVPK